MSIQWSRVERDELKPGDHIFTYRAGGSYSHHGIYTGRGEVVHFTNASLAASKMVLSRSKTPSRACANLTCLLEPGSGVLFTCVECFLKGGDVHRYQYAVSLAVLCRARGGTCTTANSDEPSTVIDRASCLYSKGFGVYSLFGKNCEDFSLYCKTGLLIDGERPRIGRSGQVSSVLGTIVDLVAIGSLRLLPQIAPAPVAAVMSAAMVSARVPDRIAAYIGVKEDVVKISVDDLVKKYHWVDRSPSFIKSYTAMISLDLGFNGKLRPRD